MFVDKYCHEKVSKMTVPKQLLIARLKIELQKLVYWV